MAFTDLQLAQYLERIGYSGTVDLTPETLNGLSLAHVCSVPFESLDINLGQPFGLDLDQVFDKLVLRRRGGYCFEQNTLFMEVLSTLGFVVRPMSARVRIGRARDFVPARTHVFLEVALDGELWLLDVGVGGLSPTGALRWVHDEVQDTPHESRRLIQEDGLWFHQALVAGEWVDVCDFTGETMHPIDRELGHWYTSPHPGSHFRGRLMVARATADGGRITLLNDRLTVRSADGTQSHHPVSHDRAVRLLEEHFGLVLPPGSVLDWAPTPT
jgi:N-hydroxyarylamine O-acetyltransferase